MKAGSYVMRPKSSASTRTARKSSALTGPSTVGTSYVLPVRLSVTLSVSSLAGAWPLPSTAVPDALFGVSFCVLTATDYAPLTPNPTRILRVNFWRRPSVALPAAAEEADEAHAARIRVVGRPARGVALGQCRDPG